MPGVSAFIWYDWMIDEQFALHARSFVNFALHARSLFERTLHSMPGVYLNFALHARSLFDLCTPCQGFTFYEHFWLHAGNFNDFTKYSNFYGRDQTLANLFKFLRPWPNFRQSLMIGESLVTNVEIWIFLILPLIIIMSIIQLALNNNRELTHKDSVWAE